MTTTNKLIVLIGLIGLIPLASGAPMDLVKDLGAIKWGPGSPRLPAGVEMVVMAGNPATKGFVSIRAKFPPGYKIPPHTHPTDEHVTILSGSLKFGMGDKIDATTAQSVEAGGYFVAEKGMHHYVTTLEGAVVQVDLEGPFEINYINPADDPERKKSE